MKKKYWVIARNKLYDEVWEAEKAKEALAIKSVLSHRKLDGKEFNVVKIQKKQPLPIPALSLSVIDRFCELSNSKSLFCRKIKREVKGS